ncbi:LOW QUALITY PROTEIN: protogenin-like, partial [Nilaparvata lugens]|uniref:LOW QUALITY PROTEIN: protogenin-like n=1 Tax=Nilaparvata lugens TaxID=108931 RepID=UPI00193D5E28
PTTDFVSEMKRSVNVLTLHNVTEHHAGTYTCTAIPNDADNDDDELAGEAPLLTRLVTLEVLSPPLVVKKPKSDVYPTAKTVRIECEAKGNHCPTFNVLTLHNVTEHHAGTYTCTAIPNDADDDDDELAGEAPLLTRLVTLEVLSPPLVVKKPKSDVYPTAKTVRIECEAKGNPLPDIVWLKNGQTLRINGRVSARNQSLVLSNSVPDDSGVYQCVLSNGVGAGAWAAARVLVNVSTSDQPAAPTSLQCTATSATQVTVTWQQPTSAKEVQAYTVHYLPTDGGEEMRTVSLNRSFTVNNLLPFTNYTFYIRAYGKKSASDQSLPVTCLTGEEVPVGAPEVQVESENPTSLSVSWTPLSDKLARGQISEYKIQWRRNDHHSTNNVDTVKDHVTHYLITGLQPDTATRCECWRPLRRVGPIWLTRRCHATGAHAASRARHALLPMPQLQLTVTNSTTILVKWSLEPVQQKVDGFHLSYRKQNGELLGPELIDARKTEHVLADLEPETWYEVVMSGISQGVEGESAVRSIQTWAWQAGEAVLMPLPAPTHLFAEPVSPTAINLTWVGSVPPANVSHYTISYHLVQTALPLHNSSIYFLNSTSTGVQITGLKAYTLYELKVRTHDENNRHSEYSQKLECRTSKTVMPGPVHDVQWKLMNSSTVRISWKEPLKVNGVIVNYTLAYSQHPAQPIADWTKTIVPASKLSTNLTSLKNNRYTLKIWASSGAGPGPPSPNLEITIPSKIGRKLPPISDQSTETTPDRKPDQILGIVIGCVIGAICIIMCTIVLVYRHKCTKPGPICRTGQAAANGSTGFYLPPSTAFDEMHEMECFTGPLDTKGGFPQDQVNGLKLTLLTNGRIPNGHATRERDHGVRITENPQFNSPIGNLSPGSCEGMRVASDEGDSLLSGGLQEAEVDALEEDDDGESTSLNDTQLTVLDCCQQHGNDRHLTACCQQHGNDRHLTAALDCCQQNEATVKCCKTERMIADDDDGFHENENHRHHHLIMLGPNG